MSTVRIPPVLRASAGGGKQLVIHGPTLGQGLPALLGRYPPLGSPLLAADADLNRLGIVYLAGHDVRCHTGPPNPVAAGVAVLTWLEPVALFEHPLVAIHATTNSDLGFLVVCEAVEVTDQFYGVAVIRGYLRLFLAPG